MSGARAWSIELSADDRIARSDTCIYPGAAAPLDRTLTTPLVLVGPQNAKRLVGIRFVTSSQRATAVWVTKALLDRIAPSAEDGVRATVRPAGRVERWGLLGRSAWIKVVGAVLILLGSAGAAAVTFATSKATFWIALAVFVCVLLGALFNAYRTVTEARAIAC